MRAAARSCICLLYTSGTSGSLTGDVVNNGVLVVERSDQVLLNGIISGTGAFVQNGGCLLYTSRCV